jgi:hypothetical protein
MRVISNPPGRIIFLALVLVTLLLMGLLGVGIVYVEEQHRWLPVIVAVLGALAFGLLIFVTFSGMVYCLRIFNIVLLLLIGLAMAAVDGVLFGTVEEAPKVLILAVSGLAVYLLGMAALLVPDAHSDLAHRMHPFVAEANLGDMKPPTAKTSKHGRKRIKHREVSIFEDWPAPVPFPAKALYSYRSASGSELPFSRGDELTILDCRGNWWQARNPKTNMTGFVPSNYIQVEQKAKVCKSFDAKDPDEVPVLEGQLIEVMEVHDLMSLVRTVDGKIGSVPTANIEVHPPNTVS